MSIENQPGTECLISCFVFVIYPPAADTRHLSFVLGGSQKQSGFKNILSQEVTNTSSGRGQRFSVSLEPMSLRRKHLTLRAISVTEVHPVPHREGCCRQTALHPGAVPSSRLRRAKGTRRGPFQEALP